MRFSGSIEINAAAEAAFAVYADVERWPTWTASMTSVERLDPGPLVVGSRARVVQPRLPAREWTVTELIPGAVFTWETRSPGLRTIGRHTIARAPAGCTAIAELEHHGPLAPLVGALTARLTRRYLQLELDGLKTRCEHLG